MIYNDYGFENEIVLEDASFFINTDETKEIAEQLNKAKIGFTCVETRSLMHSSILQGINLVINENLTSLIISGLMMPLVYDALKTSIKLIFTHFSGSEKPPLILKCKTKSGSIIAPIPTELSNAQFDKYMDTVTIAIQNLKIDDTKHEQYVAECDLEKQSIKMLMLQQYGYVKHNETH